MHRGSAGCSRICSVAVSTESRERAAVENRAARFLDDLRDWLAIPSIGADPDHHGEVARSALWLADELRMDGWPTVEVWSGDSQGEPCLPAVFACWPSTDPEAPSVLVYGHHDVQPVDPLDAWEHPPFEPTLLGAELHGRGASDDKGQVLMHLLGLQAHLEATGADAPAVTVKLLVEGEEESGSPHIAALLADHADELACDAIVVTGTGMFSRDTPSMCTGMRGMADAEVVFRGAAMDLHSGQFGGAVPNPVTELARMLAALHDGEGRVAIPGFYDDVREPPAAERAAFARLPFDEAAWLSGPAGGSRSLRGETGWSTVERLWVRPTAEVNGVSGGYAGPGHKTIVPAEAVAKVSFRLVPDQQPVPVQRAFAEFVAAHTPEGIQPEVHFTGSGVSPCASDVDHPVTESVRLALQTALGTEVLYAREGGSGPEAVIAEALRAPLAFLGVGLPDDRIHAPNEKVVLPLLHRGAEAAAHLWRLLGERRGEVKGRS
ncbi:MAG: M20/M25/M40 family metallo-hydrolase [Pseudonocardiaceae bacterium]|nr:M20/M25/M40 family metallo-hydrolase [Pseudonocardiaceae bacterium]